MNNWGDAMSKNISGVVTWLKQWFYDKGEINNSEPEYIVGTHGTTATATWSGTCSKLTQIKDGTVIFFYLTSAGASNVTLNLTLANGTSTGAKNVYFKGTTRLSTHYPINSVVALVYTTKKDNGAWYVSSANDNNSWNATEYGTVQFTAGEALTTRTLCGAMADGKYYKLSSGRSFLTAYPIIGTNGAISKDAISNNEYLPRYDEQVTNTKSMTLTNGKPLFIEGDNYENGLFTVSSNVLTHNFTNGKYYWLVGFAYSASNFRSNRYQQILYYNGTNLIPVCQPLSHNHTKSEISDFPSFGTAAGTICQGNDSRLSDTRNPKSNSIVASSSSIKDLNDYTTTGFYYNHLNTQAQYIIHCPNSNGTATPYTANKAFFLLVENFNNDGNYTKQTLTYYDTNKTYTRIRNNGTWGNWYEISANTNYYDRMYSTAQIVGGEALTKNAIVVGKTDYKYYNLKSGQVFNVRYPILWTNTAVTSGGNTNNAYIIYNAVNLQSTISGKTVTNQRQVYIEGTNYENGDFTTSSNVFVSDGSFTSGRYYIPIGIAYSTTNIRFNTSDSKVFYYDGTKLIPVEDSKYVKKETNKALFPSNDYNINDNTPFRIYIGQSQYANLYEYLQNIYNQAGSLATTYAPMYHATNNSTIANNYGKASTSNWGHVKIINALTQTSYSDGLVLSAYQGKVLSDRIDDLGDDLVSIDASDVPFTPNSQIWGDYQQVVNNVESALNNLFILVNSATLELIDNVQQSSNNPVKSSGIYTALSNKEDKTNFTLKQTITKSGATAQIYSDDKYVYIKFSGTATLTANTNLSMGTVNDAYRPKEGYEYNLIDHVNANIFGAVHNNGTLYIINKTTTTSCAIAGSILYPLKSRMP